MLTVVVLFTVMSDKDILTDIIPVLHRLRRNVLDNQGCLHHHLAIISNSGLNESPNFSEDPIEAEIDDLMHQLIHLEFYLDHFDRLSVVAALKNAIADHINITAKFPSASQNDIGLISVAKLSHKKGLDPVRLKILKLISSAIEQIATIDELLTTSLPDDLVSKKKKRCTNFFASFNFDDLPVFEPLEITLRLLRANSCSIIAFQKLMLIDIGELVEHPQWFELMTLLHKSLLSSSNSDELAFIIRLHVRYIEYLEGQQCMDVIINLLKFYWKIWGGSSHLPAVQCQQNNSKNNVLQPFQTNNVKNARMGDGNQVPHLAAEELAHLSKISTTQVLSFLYIVKRCNTTISQCSDNSAEVAVVLIFLLLAQGHVESRTEDSTHLTGEAMAHHSISLLDCIFVLDSKCTFDVHFINNFKPLMVINVAIQSNILAVLLQQMETQIQRSRSPDKNAPAMKRYLLQNKLFFDICSPWLGSSADVIYELASSSAQEARVGDLLINEQGHVVLEVVSDLNKYFSQLRGTRSVWHLFADSSIALEDRLNLKPKIGSSGFASFLAATIECFHVLISNCDPENLYQYRALIVGNIEHYMSLLRDETAIYCDAHKLIKYCADALTRLLLVPNLNRVDVAQKILVCLKDTTFSVKKDSGIAEHMMRAWLTISSITLKLVNNPNAISCESDFVSTGVSAFRHKNASLLCSELLSGWNTFLLYYQDVLRVGCVDNKNTDLVLNDPDFSAALEDVVVCAKDFSRFLTQAQETRETILGDEDFAECSKFVRGSVAFIINVIKGQWLSNATFLRRPDFIPDLLEILLRSLMGNFVLDETANGTEFRKTSVSESLVTMCSAFGDKIMLESSSWSGFLTFLELQTVNEHAWEFVESWYEGDSHVFSVIDFLARLTFAGKANLAFLIMRKAWNDFDEFCRAESVQSFAQLLGLGGDRLLQLSNYPFYVIILRVANVALFDTSFCCEIRIWRHEFGALDIDNCESNDMNLHSCFWNALERRILSIACVDRPGWYYFLPFTQSELTALGLAHANPTLLPQPSEQLVSTCSSADPCDPCSLNIFSGNKSLLDIMQLFAMHSGSNIENVNAHSAACSADRLAKEVFLFLCDSSDKSGIFTNIELDNVSKDVSQDVNWLLVCSVAIGVSTIQQFQKLLSCLRIDSESSLKFEIEKNAQALLSTYRSGQTRRVFARLDMSVTGVLHSILHQWFTPFLNINDIALVTAATWVHGPMQAAMVAATIVVTISDVLHNSTQEWGTRGGAEAVIRAICYISSAKLRISNNSILSELRVLATGLPNA